MTGIFRVPFKGNGLLLLALVLGLTSRHAAASQCGLAVCFVVDASSSIENANLGTFQNVVKPFLKTVATRIQAIAGGTAEFGGAWFGTSYTKFLPNMTGSVASLNASVEAMRCPECSSCWRSKCVCSEGVQCNTGTQWTNMDGGLLACFNTADGGILKSATAGKPQLVLMITDGAPNRKMDASPPTGGSGPMQFPGVSTATTYDCGTPPKTEPGCDATTHVCTPPDTSSDSNPTSECAATAAGLRALDMRQRGISFVSIGVGADARADFLRNISTDFYTATNYAALLEDVEGIVSKLCSDVAITKTATPQSTLVSHNVAYTVTLRNAGAYAYPPPVGFTDQLPPGTTLLGAVTPVDGAPLVSCPVTGAPATGQLITCTASATADMPVGASWAYTYTVRADTAGNKTNTAALLRTDAVENNQAQVTVTAVYTCSDPWGNGTQSSCPVGTVWAGHEHLNYTDASYFLALCCVSADVSVDKSCNTSTALTGGSVTFTIRMHNSGPNAAPAPQTFTDTLPAGLVYVGPMALGPGTPAASCTMAAGPNVGTVLSCSVGETLAAGATWTFSYPVTVTGLGPLTNTVQLDRVDTNTSNNAGSSTITAWGTCAGPHGTEQHPACPPGTQFAAPDALIASDVQFNATCCQAFDVDIDVGVYPGSGIIGTNFHYSVDLFSVGGNSSLGPNGFVLTLPPGLTLDSGPTPAAGTNTPAVSCTPSGTNGQGYTLTCSAAGALTPGAPWNFTFDATATLTGQLVVLVALTNPDSSPADDTHQAVVDVYVTCGNPFGNGTRAAVPAGSQYVGPDDKVMANSTGFVAACTQRFNVAIDVGVDRGEGLLGTLFTYAVSLSAPAGASALAPNSFDVSLQPGLVLVTPLTPGSGTTPTATCTAAGQLVSCVVNATLPEGTAWNYTFTARGNATGNQTATVSLTKPDASTADDTRSVTVTLYVTCAQPNGLGSTPACPAGLQYKGPDGTQLASTDAFVSTCCAAADVHVFKAVNATSALNGSVLEYTITLSNAGPDASPPPNGFVDTLPPGLKYLGSMTTGPGTPQPTCTVTTDTNTATVLNCTVDATLGAAAVWRFHYLASPTLLGDAVNTVRLPKLDTNGTNNADSVAVNVHGICSDPYGDGRVLRCPLNLTYTGPDSLNISGPGGFVAACCSPFDVGVTVDVNPRNTSLNTPVIYLLELHNYGIVPSQHPNTFVLKLPRGMKLIGSPTRATAITPAVTVVASRRRAGRLLLQDAPTLLTLDPQGDLPANSSWVYNVTLSGSQPGAQSVVVSLLKPDTNSTNNEAFGDSTLYPVCRDPFGNGTQPPCPPGRQFIPSAGELALSGADAYNAWCCQPFDVDIDLTAAPATGLVGDKFTYTISMSTVGGNVSIGPNAFLVTVPSGLDCRDGNPVPASPGTPTVTCTRTTSGVGLVINCSTDADLPGDASFNYTLVATGAATGTYTVSAALVKPDGNPSDDVHNVTTQVFVECGNPFANGTRPACTPGTTYMGPPNARLPNPDAFAMLCCVSQLELPGNVAVTITPGATYPLGVSIPVTFTVNSNGGGYANETLLKVDWPIGLMYVSMRVLDNTGAEVDALQYCDPPSGASTGTPATVGSISCFLSDMPPQTQMQVVLTFAPPTAANYTPILANVMATGLTAVAESWANVLDCPPYQAVVGNTCQSAICNPCPDATPDVYLSTGKLSKPPHALWRIRGWRPNQGTTWDLAPEFLCVVDVEGEIGDISLLHQGDVVILDTAGNLRYIPVDALPTNGSSDFTRKCPTLPLYRFTGYASYTGLSSGFRSDMLLATTGDGYVVPLLMTMDAQQGKMVAKAPLPGSTDDQPVRLGCWTDSINQPITNTGGTDLTPGPDGNYYRWCGKDNNMHYTGTRFKTTNSSGYPQLRGPGEFVSNKVYRQGATATFSNAGAFCTSSSVIGVGTYTRSVPDALAGSYVAFWSFGYANNKATTVTGMSKTNLPPANLVGQTLPDRNPDGSVHIDGLRVNGAAVKPQCWF